MEYVCEIRKLPMCCGFLEAGAFGDEEYADCRDDNLSDFLDQILEEGAGRPVIFNFVKFHDAEGDFDDDYQYDDLRQWVLSHKNVVDLGEHINPNSGNKIHSLIIKDYK